MSVAALRRAVWCAATAICPLAALAQGPGITLEQAVAAAMDRYPAIEAGRQRAAAAGAAIALARTSYLPRADFGGQINRATNNNVAGMLLQQPAIAPISGPVLYTNTLRSVWGSAVGMLVSWEPFDFGRRRAGVAAAQAARETADARVEVTRLDVGAAAADAFLSLLAAEQTVLAARAGVERARLTHQMVESLAANELRPGADESRARAELAAAAAQLVRAEQAVETARAELSRLVDIPPREIALLSGPLLELPPGSLSDAPASTAEHPAATAQDAAVREAEARRHVLDRSYYPRFALLGTTSVRGSGIRSDFTAAGGASGLAPNFRNWGLGLSVTFPLLDAPAIGARKAAAASQSRAEAARYRQVLQDIGAEVAKAEAALEGARRIAEVTPIQLDAARAAEQQASARYRAGLAALVEVADAQRLLTQAEIDDRLARLAVWRAELSLATARGDLAPFLRMAGR